MVVVTCSRFQIKTSVRAMDIRYMKKGCVILTAVSRTVLDADLQSHQALLGSVLTRT